MRLGSSRRSLDGDRIRRRKRKLDSDEVGELALAALERSEAVLANIGDGVFSTDPGGHIVLWNNAAERVIGCSPGKAQGKSCAHILGLSIRDEPLDCSNGCALVKELNGDGDFANVEVTRTRKDGREQPLLINVTPIKDCDGEVTEFVHSMRDITELKRADEAKTMFLATASHELKTPLTVILGFTQALRSDWLDTEQRNDALQSIERRARELSRIVDRLLLTGRIESGRITVTPTIVELKEVVPERVTSLAMATGRNLVCDLPDDVPPVLADSDGLMTVLDHLLDNAVKYSPDGGDVVVTAKSDRAGVEIAVADHGIGMSDDDASRCFDRFWQAESSDVRRFGGTGVGLYIVRSLIEAMGGTVRVRSMHGAGSTFVLRLKRVSEEEIEKVRKPQTEPGVGKRTMIQEFMHQIGVPGGGGGGGGGS